MFKRILIIALTVALLCTVFGCEKKSATLQNLQSSEPQNTQETVTENVYEGGNMRFFYVGEMNFYTADAGDNVKNISAVSKDNTVCVSNMFFKSSDAMKEGLFEQVIDFETKYREILTEKKESGKANSGNGTKDVMIYTVTGIDSENNEYETYCAVQVQSFENSCYIVSVARADTPNEEKINQLNAILNSVVYDEAAIESKAEAITIEDMKYEQFATYAILQRYMNLEQKIDVFSVLEETAKKSEQLEASISKEMKDVEGFELMVKSEIMDYVNKCEVLVPRGSSYNLKSLISYISDGIHFNVSTTKMSPIEKALEDSMKIIEDTYNKNKKIYTDIAKDEAVSRENTVYQHISVKEIQSDNTTYNIDDFVMVQKNGEVTVIYRISLREKNFTAKTNALLEEMQKAYSIPLTQYKANEDAITMSGKPVDKGQEVYIYNGEGAEVIQAPGYEMLGIVDLKLNSSINSIDKNVKVMIPRGKYTYVYDSYVSCKMHGVRVNVELGNLYAETGLNEKVKKDLGYSNKFWKENPRDYKAIKEILMQNSEDEGREIGIIGCKKVDFDGNEYGFYEIKLGIDLSESYQKNESLEYYLPYAGIVFTVEMADTDSRTQVLYDEIKKAYGIDIKALIEEYEKR